MHRESKLDFYVYKLMQVKLRTPRSDLDHFLPLLRMLNSIPFSLPTVINRDRNREGDGRYLRHTMENEFKETFDFCGAPCSFLEMMVALCNRLDLEYMAYYTDRSTPWDLFTLMLDSMGLSPDSSKEDVSTATRTVIERTYGPNGRGGLFYISGFIGDMRLLEIWDQAMAYIHGYIGIFRVKNIVPYGEKEQ